jgi:hypothetical protein
MGSAKRLSLLDAAGKTSILPGGGFYGRNARFPQEIVKFRFFDWVGNKGRHP